MLGTRTRGGRMEGVNESTVLAAPWADFSVNNLAIIAKGNFSDVIDIWFKYEPVLRINYKSLSLTTKNRCSKELTVQGITQISRYSLKYFRSNTSAFRGTAIAWWIRLHLPFCSPGFKSQANHLRFYTVKFCTFFAIVYRKGRK